jgi:hypothetical protein
MGALAVAIAALAAAALPPSTAGTTLRIAAKDPLTIRATGFGSRETVKVVVRSRTSSVTQVATSNRAGGFSVSFPGVRLDGASDLDVSAIGAKGHRASFSVRHTTGGAVSKI